MKIGINAYPLAREFSGTGTYLFNLVKYLEIYDRKNEYYLYSRPGIKLPFKQNLNWHIITVSGLLNKSSTYWMVTSAKKQILKDRIDLFWATENVLPLDLPRNIKTVINVYDLVWRYFPQVLNFDNFFILPLFANRSIKKADQVLTISSCVGKDTEKIYNIDSDKISVIYLGVDEKFKPFDKNESAEYISKKYGVSDKYVLFVSTIEPKKNVANLLKAFDIFKKKYNFPHQLLLAGGKRLNDFGIHRLCQELKLSKKETDFLGYIDFNDLPMLYSGAEVFILPSLYEGFGLTPLEAMACGTPVIASDIPTFQEILGEAALLVDRYKPEKISEAIYRVLIDSALAQELIRKGLEKAKLFSWEKTAKETLKIFEKIEREF